MADKPNIVHLDEVDSTNEEAKRRAALGETGPLWIHADQQTKGRGRRGRDWSSPTGNLFATGLYTINEKPSEAAQLSFAAALAVSDLCLNNMDASRVTVKWPNDVLIDRKKVAGILLESGWSVDKRLWLAVGIGINLKTHPIETEWPATNLSEAVIDLSTVDALHTLISAFDTWKDRWHSHGFTSLRDAWLSRAHGLGETCHVRLADEALKGTFSDLMPDGSLRLDLADGSRRYISAGDVFFPDHANPLKG